MDEGLISARDVAQELDVHPRSILKVFKRLGIEVTKQRDASRGNQLASHIQVADVDRVAEEIARTARSTESNGQDDLSTGFGFFYVLQLEPNHDPGRFKVGFASSVRERLRQHRCSAPFAVVVKTWSCRGTWERTAIDCVTVGCEKLHTEVFRTDCLETVVERCNTFFGIMPTDDESAEDD